MRATIVYRGEDVPSLRGRVGYMMQKDLLFPWRTVLGNVLLGLEMRGVTHRAAVEARRANISMRSGSPASRTPIRRLCPAACASAWR